MAQLNDLLVLGKTNFLGQVNIYGNASSCPLKVRGIVGSDGTGVIDDLYLQYGANKPLHFGNSGTYTISADGGTYSGKSTTAGTADEAIKLKTSRTFQTNLGSTSTGSFNGESNVELGVKGTLGVTNGGTGQTSAINACNSFLNELTTGSSVPTDEDYFISQYVNGGTTNTTFHRRPVKHLYSYIEGKADTRYLKLSGGTLTGNLLLSTTGNTVNSRIQRSGVSKSWYQGRDAAIIKTTSYTGYDALVSLKTTAGDWSMGTYNDNKLYLTYILDSNYNNNQNVTTAQIRFDPDGSVTASKFVGNVTGNVTGNATTSSYPLGFNTNGGNITWGTLAGDTTTTTGYRTIARWDSPNSGSVAFADGPMNDNNKKGQTSMQIDGYYYQEEGTYQVLDNRYMVNTTQSPNNSSTATGLVCINTRLVVKGNGASYNEGIRIVPASNGWSNIYFSDNTSETNYAGVGTNGWLVGRRGAAGSSTTASAGDFTIECNNSDGRGLTLKPNGNAFIYGDTFSLGNTKISLQYIPALECLSFVFN